jgi:hypothetical protein
MVVVKAPALSESEAGCKVSSALHETYEACRLVYDQASISLENHSKGWPQVNTSLLVSIVRNFVLSGLFWSDRFFAAKNVLFLWRLTCPS